MPDPTKIPTDLSYRDTTVVAGVSSYSPKMSCGHIIEWTDHLCETYGVDDRLLPGTRIACFDCRDLTLLKERIAELEDHIGLHIEMAEGRQR